MVDRVEVSAMVDRVEVSAMVDRVEVSAAADRGEEPAVQVDAPATGSVVARADSRAACSAFPAAARWGSFLARRRFAVEKR